MTTANWQYTNEPKVQAQSFYNGLMMSVYLPTEPGMKAWWVVSSNLTEEGEKPTVEWDIRITGVADSEEEGKLAAERCAEVLLGALGVVRLASHAGAKDAAFWRTLREGTGRMVKG